MEKVGVLVYWVYSKVYPQRLIENNRNLIYPVNIKRMPPKTKRIMTPEMLEKLALARAKANETRQAMRSENDELKLKVLQSKIDNIKKTRPTKTPEPKPEAEPVVPEDAPTCMDDAPEKADICELSAPEPEPVPDTFIVNDTPPASPVKAKKKKSKKPLVIVSASDSGSSDDNSNVIYIRRKSKSKDKESATAPQQPPQPPPPQPTINPFFSFYHGSHRNFQ